MICECGGERMGQADMYQFDCLGCFRRIPIKIKVKRYMEMLLLCSPEVCVNSFQLNLCSLLWHLFVDVLRAENNSLFSTTIYANHTYFPNSQP